MELWLGFLVCTAIIVVSGSQLSKYGDIIAEKTGLGRVWIGVVLMASVTSLPELVTGIGSVTFGAVPDIAIGDVLGSCVFNMLIIALLDAINPGVPLSSRAQMGNILAASFGIVLLGIAAISLFMGSRMPALGWVGVSSGVFMLIYLVAMRMVYLFEQKRAAELIESAAAASHASKVTLKHAIIRYGLNALIVLAAALFLPSIGDGIARQTGLGQTFVGTILIAVTTSLPEVVVSFAAIRLGAPDMAIGNLFGSNLFNICILAVDDLFFIRGPLLAQAHPSHTVSAISAMIMTAIAIAGLIYRSEKKQLFLAWDAIGIVIVYGLNLFALYALR